MNTETHTTIDVSMLPGGVYIVQLSGARAVKMGKIIKQ